MKFGEIHCSCGQVFYFETNRSEINCVSCGLAHYVEDYPLKEEVVEENLLAESAM